MFFLVFIASFIELYSDCLYYNSLKGSSVTRIFHKFRDLDAYRTLICLHFTFHDSLTYIVMSPLTGLLMMHIMKEFQW